MLEETHKPDSKWRPYLDILPKDLSCFPITYGAEEAKYLTGSYLAFTISEDANVLKGTYDKLCEEHEGMKQYTFEEYCGAAIISCSRSFAIAINGKMMSSFVPMADMMNHH